MKFYVGVTDNDWFDYLKSLPGIDEVNFWQPSPGSQFRSLERGDLFLFKLHRSARTFHKDLIAGGGVFYSFTTLPISLAWEAFEKRNGAETFAGMRRQLLQYRQIPDNPHEDFQIGCIILTQPFFFDRSLWFPAPDWSASIVRGKASGYELDKEAGKSILKNLEHALHKQNAFNLGMEVHQIDEAKARYGKEIMIRPRLGQGTFKIAVTDAYHRSCAITEEHTLPVLEAAHIKPFSDGGPHEISNGLLLRSDIHRLFDKGYITVTPDLHIEVSRRIREEFENGRYYYPFDGHLLNHFPKSPQERPDKEVLIWHNENVFRD